MTQQTVYKVVYKKDGKFWSMLMEFFSNNSRYSTAICEYKIGEKTIPPIEHSLLFALTDRDYAINAASVGRDTMGVMECIAEVVQGPERIMFFLGVYTFSEFWKVYHLTGRTPEELVALDSGQNTAFCQYILPVRLIE